MDFDNRHILDALQDAAVLMRRDGICTYVNPAFCLAFGGAAARWTGRALDLSGLSLAQAEDGSAAIPGDVDWRETVLDEETSLYVGRVIDTTSQMRRLATMSHEMRTPLNGILGMTDLLMNTELDANQTAYADAVRQSGAALLTLINDILDFSKAEAGHLALQAAPFEPRALVQNVAELLSPRAGERNLDIAAYISPSVPARLISDASRLRQILLNLAGNGVKFTDKGGVAIEVYAEPCSMPDSDLTLRVDVIDTGIGIDEAERASVFNEFSQAGTQHDRKQEGTGLGLAIVRQIVRAMKGDVTLESTPGKGSVFTVRIPVTRARADGNGQIVAEPVRSPVIVLTRSPIMARSLRAQLAAARVSKALITSDIAKASKALAQTTDALLLCDRPMVDLLAPGSIAKAGRAIVLLADNSRDQLPSLRKRGFDGYLVKPIRQATLVERLHETLPPRLSRTVPDTEIAANTQGAPYASQRAASQPAASQHEERSHAKCIKDQAPANDERTYRVLLAEDNEINAVLASTILKNCGHTVDVVANGEEALQAVQASAYDVVLMDMHMPVMDGLSAAQALRKMDGSAGRLPVIALTANSLRKDQNRCLEAGMDDFLTKPFDPVDLRRLVSRWGQGRDKGRAAA